MMAFKVLCAAGARLDGARWQDEIRRAGFDLELEGEVPVAPGTPRFVRGRFEGVASGFDLAAEPFDPGAWELSAEDRARVAAFDVVLVLTTYPNAQEIAASVAASAAYAHAAGGVILDAWFEQRIVPAAEALEWARSKLPDIRRQFDGPSRVRAGLE